MSITEQLITDSANFIMMTDPSTRDMEDIQTKPDEIQLANSADGDDGMIDINSDWRNTVKTQVYCVCRGHLMLN